MAERYHPLATCERCPLREADSYVPTAFGQGPVPIVGMAPGREEVRAGTPFVGRSGKLLAQVVQRAGAMELLGDGTLTNAVSCMPEPNDKGETKVPVEAIECCAPRLRAELEGAEQILALGREASRAVTGQYLRITDSPHVASDQWQGRRVVVGPHPAAVLRVPAYTSRLESAIARLSQADVTVTWEWPPFTTARTREEADRVHDDHYQLWGEPIVIDTEYVGATKWDRFDVERLRCLGVELRDGQRSFIVVYGEQALADPVVQADLSTLLSHNGVVAHNGKTDLGVLARRGIHGRLAGDTMYGVVPLDERPMGRGLAALCSRYLGLPDWKPPKAQGEDGGSWYAEVGDDELYAYNARDVAATRALMDEERRLGGWNHPLHRDLLVPALEFLCGVEDYGMGVDDERLAEVIERYERETETRRAAFVGCFEGVQPNPNAPHQVLAELRAAGENVVNTRKETLRDLIQTSRDPAVVDVVGKLLEYRKWAKELTTYLRPLATRATRDGRVHAEFNPAGTETGRMTCVRPNLQNWPREGAARSVFWAGEGRRYVKVDLSQAELRVIAVESGDEALLEVCRAGDLHAEVARQVGINRVAAKSINFGIPFGRTPEGIVRQLALPEHEARAVVRAYFERFPKVAAWQEDVKCKVAAGEPLTTPFGRTRRPLDVALLDRGQRGEAEREMLAFTSQAVVSDITLTAGIEAARRGVQVVNLVHDELRTECDESEVVEVTEILRECVRAAGQRYSDQVEFPVDTKSTAHWM